MFINPSKSPSNQDKIGVFKVMNIFMDGQNDRIIQLLEFTHRKNVFVERMMWKYLYDESVIRYYYTLALGIPKRPIGMPGAPVTVTFRKADICSSIKK